MNPEAAFMFLVFLGSWVLTEFKLSEEVQLREASKNDVRVARELLKLHKGMFRRLFKEDDLFQYRPSSDYSTCFSLNSRHETKELHFQDDKLNRLFDEFMEVLDRFNSHISGCTVPINIGDTMRTGFKPDRYVSDEEYNEQRDLAKVANNIADDAWKKLEALVGEIKKRVPEAFDEPL